MREKLGVGIEKFYKLLKENGLPKKNEYRAAVEYNARQKRIEEDGLILTREMDANRALIVIENGFITMNCA